MALVAKISHIFRKINFNQKVFNDFTSGVIKPTRKEVSQSDILKNFNDQDLLFIGAQTSQEVLEDFFEDENNDDETKISFLA